MSVEYTKYNHSAYEIRYLDVVGWKFRNQAFRKFYKELKNAISEGWYICVTDVELPIVVIEELFTIEIIAELRRDKK